MCKNALEVLYPHPKFGGAWISPAAGAAKNVVFLLPAAFAKRKLPVFNLLRG